MPADFPRAALKQLAQFGRGLRADERIELADSATAPERATLTTETRKRIQRLASLDELEIETSLVGLVNGLSSIPPHVDLTITDRGQQRRIGGAFSDQSIWDSLHGHLGYGELAPPVSLSVIAVQNRDGEIIRITDVLHTEPALPPAWTQRLHHLENLENNWLHPGSEPPLRVVIERVERILLATLDAGVGAPAIYPSGNGGIQLEWRTNTRAVEVEVLNDNSLEATWYGRSNGDDGQDQRFEVGDPDGVADFVKEAVSE